MKRIAYNKQQSANIIVVNTTQGKFKALREVYFNPMNALHCQTINWFLQPYT